MRANRAFRISLFFTRPLKAAARVSEGSIWGIPSGDAVRDRREVKPSFQSGAKAEAGSGQGVGELQRARHMSVPKSLTMPSGGL